MQDSYFTVLEMLGGIYEDLDIEKIEEKFVGLVGDAFSFDRVALFFMKHKKELLKGKLSRGFVPGLVEQIEIPIASDSILARPLISGAFLRNPEADGDPYAELLGLNNFALVPIVNKRRVPCWEIRNCRSLDCPAYGKKWIRCWLVSGTKCNSGSDIPSSQKKLECSTCPIFVDAGIETIEGVMLVDNSISGKPITDEVMTVLSIISHTVGMAINNSKIYMKTRDVAIRDALTGLHNRRYFDERLLDEVERAARYGEALSLVICDIDLFKRVNDTYGHPFGDSVLCWVSGILNSHMRKSDVLARYGGEEFAFLLLNAYRTQAEAIAEKMRLAIEEHPFRHGDIGLPITLSFGVASFGAKAGTIEDLISNADEALYKAKAQGRNRVCSS